MATLFARVISQAMDATILNQHSLRAVRLTNLHTKFECTLEQNPVQVAPQNLVAEPRAALIPSE